MPGPLPTRGFPRFACVELLAFRAAWALYVHGELVLVVVQLVVHIFEL